MKLETEAGGRGGQEKVARRGVKWRRDKGRREAERRT